MKMWRGIAMILSAALFCGAATAAENEMRMDVQGREEGVKLEIVQKPEGGAGYHASWVKSDEEKARYLTFRKNLGSAEWQKVSFSLKSDTDTKLRVSLSAKWKKNDDGTMAEIPTWYDDISATGADLKMDFENASSDGELKIPGWWFNKEKPPVLVDEAGVAKQGSKCLKVTNTTGLATNMDVKAGEEVTITFWVKGE